MDYPLEGYRWPTHSPPRQVMRAYCEALDITAEHLVKGDGLGMLANLR